MNIPDVVELLKQNGVIRTESAVKFIAKKYGLYNKSDSPRPGLDTKIVSRFVKISSSPLRVAEIARGAGTTYSKVNYYILKHRIAVVKEFGVTLLKNKKDIEYVKSFL